MAFFQPPARVITPPIVIFRDYQTKLGVLDARAQGLGGWSLDVQHAYDPTGQVLHLGDGEERDTKGVGNAVNQGAPGAFFTSGLAAAPNGNLYATTSNASLIQVLPDQTVTRVAGTGDAFSGSAADGVPATTANLPSLRGLAFGRDGSLYLVTNQRLRRVGPDGLITTIAGGAPGIPIAPCTLTSDACGDGGPGISARLRTPVGVALGPDDSVYVADYDLHRVRRIGSDGIITTVAGNGTYGASQFDRCDGRSGLATAAKIFQPQGVAVGRDGTLFISAPDCGQVFRVGIDGQIALLAGGGQSSSSADGIRATDVSYFGGPALAVGPDGSVYSGDINRLRRIGPGGIITTVAGNGSGCLGTDACGLAGLPTAAGLNVVYATAVAPNGVVYYATGADKTPSVLAINPALPGFSGDTLTVASRDGRELYQFDLAGLHLQTLDALTGAVRYAFAYDSEHRLTSVTDVDGDVTTIERNANGDPTALVAPGGQRTTLTVNAGYLASVVDPAGHAIQLTYGSGDAEGLLATLTDPRGNTRHYTYDSLGRLARDENAAGGALDVALVATPGTRSTTLTTALGRTTTFLVEALCTGSERQVVTAPDGTTRQLLVDPSDVRTLTRADGLVTTSRFGPDPRFGMQAPLLTSEIVQTPAGLVRTMTRIRSANLADSTNPFSLITQSDAIVRNGRTYTRIYAAANRTTTLTSPLGRPATVVRNARGRITQIGVAGLTPVQIGYDGRGRPTLLAHGARTYAFAYDDTNALTSLTDPLGHVLSIGHDAAGRLTTATRPDGQSVEYAYDANSNLTGLTPPGKPAHSFAFTAADLIASEQPPAIPGPATSTQLSYDADRNLTELARGGATFAVGYEASGRVQTFTHPKDTITATYDAAGRPKTLAASSGVTLTYAYDGPLVTDTTWSGALTGTVHRTFDTDFRIVARTINGGASQSFAYDDDGFRTQVGAMTLIRDPQNGLVTGTTLDTVSDARTFDGFGASATYQATTGGSPLFSGQYTRDPAGRILHKSETVGGVTTTHDYDYDAVGRLVQVSDNGLVAASYTYDANGNRLTGPGALTPATYDAQDRLAQYGDTTYTYEPGGALLSKSLAGETTTYDYDLLGNLRGASVSGTQIDYLIDGANRRIGVKVNGVKVQGFLYQDQLKPIAELDGNDVIVSTFVYGSRPNVPDAMIKGGMTYRIIADEIGSPRVVVRADTGVIAQRLDYDEFGNVVADTNPGFQPFGFAGGLYDRHTSLVRFGARDYDPEMGRWTGKDPGGFGGGLNLYAYAYGDPINYVDLSGRIPLALAPAAAGGGTAAAGGGTAAAGGASALGLGATSAFIATAAILGVPVAVSIVAIASLIDSAETNGDATGDDEGDKEGGAPPQDGEVDGGDSCPTPLIPQKDTDRSPPPTFDEGTPTDDFLSNPTFPGRGPTPRIPYPETPENGFDDPSLDAPFRL